MRLQGLCQLSALALPGVEASKYGAHVNTAVPSQAPVFISMPYDSMSRAERFACAAALAPDNLAPLFMLTAYASDFASKQHQPIDLAGVYTFMQDTFDVRYKLGHVSDEMREEYSNALHTTRQLALTKLSNSGFGKQPADRAYLEELRQRYRMLAQHAPASMLNLFAQTAKPEDAWLYSTRVSAQKDLYGLQPSLTLPIS